MEIPALETFFERYRLPLLIAFLGIILVGAGILFLGLAKPEDKIEIISSEEKNVQETIFVDIEGAIEKPGVYELPSGSRMNDLLIACGGFSAEADREWAEKSLNKAQKLTDGIKIYVPKTGETPKSTTSSTGLTGGTGNSSGGLVNINTASKSELEALWGIGPVTAQKIIDSRPYQTVEELLAKKILYRNVYQRIESQLTVY